MIYAHFPVSQHQHLIASEFYRLRLLNVLFSKWHQCQPDWLTHRQNARIRPLLYWSFTLSRKVVFAWKQAVEERRKLRDACAAWGDQKVVRGRMLYLHAWQLVGWTCLAAFGCLRNNTRALAGL